MTKKTKTTKREADLRGTKSDKQTITLNLHPTTVQTLHAISKIANENVSIVVTVLLSAAIYTTKLPE